MKLDTKIHNRRIAYLLSGDHSAAFELAILYYILAKRRTAENKIADACLKSSQWLGRGGIETPDNITQFAIADQLELLERVLVQNKTMVCRKADLPAGRQASLVRAIPVYNRDLGLALQ